MFATQPHRIYPNNHFFTRRVGKKHYELNDHLGNVRATVTDRKVASFQQPQGGNWNITGFTADITSAQDYYPFGMTMPGRQFNPEEYRHGFQGMEKDDEIKGAGNSLDFGARMYDSRIGRWLCPDPANQFILSQYLAFANNPILLIDPDGRWVPGVDNNGRIILTAEEGDDLSTLYLFFGDKDGKNASKYLPTVWTNSNVAPKIHIQTGTQVRFDSDNIFSEAMSQKKTNPELFYDTHPNQTITGNDIPDTYNCHTCAINASQGKRIIDQGNMSVGERNSNLGEAIGSDKAIFGETIITFGDDHSATYFGTSSDGTVFTFSKHGDKWSPNISPVFDVVNGGANGEVPGGGYGPVRGPGKSAGSVNESQDSNLNKDGTSRGGDKGGYYEPKGK